MSDADLARLAADCLSGPNRLTNVRRLKSLLRVNWSTWERVWAAMGKRAPLVCDFNLTGMTAERDHWPFANALTEFAKG